MKKRIFNFIIVILVIPILLAFFYVNAEVNHTKKAMEVAEEENFLSEFLIDTKVFDTAKIIIPYTNKRGDEFEIIFEPKNGHLFLRTRDYTWSYDNFFYFNDLTDEISKFFMYDNIPLGYTGFRVSIGLRNDYPYWEPRRFSKRKDVFGNDMVYFADAYLKDSIFHISALKKEEADSLYSEGYPYFDNLEITKNDLKKMVNLITKYGCESHHFLLIEDDGSDNRFFEYFFYDYYSNCYQFFSDGYNNSEYFFLMGYFSKTVFMESEKDFPYYYPDFSSFAFRLSEGPQGIKVFFKNFKDEYRAHKIVFLGVSKFLDIIEERKR